MVDYNAGVEDEYHCFHCDKVTNEDDVADNWFIIHGRTPQYVIGYSCPECWSVEHHNESQTKVEMVDYNAGVEDEYHCFHCDKVTNEDDVTDNWFIIHGRTPQYVIGYSCPECWSVEHHNESQTGG